jgi:sterol desaturase/sphingolipid hydroxylase (fatty acid hydroxylase superfamily)
MSRNEQPIRLFKSDILEFFTHVHPAVVLIIWLPVALYHLALAVSTLPASGLTPLHLVAGFVVGVVVWSLTEYTVHRFIFHFEPKNPPPWLERMIFLFHGIHHAQPWDKTRLVMPPAVSVPLALLFYFLFSRIVGGVMSAPQWVDVLFSGFVVGYVAYDMIHYATHHLPLKWGALKWLKKHHMLHHYKTPNERYGVSSPAWDVVFGTYPDDQGMQGQVAES